MAQQTGAIYHQGILYSGGGGTNVTPNPQGEATDTLNTVEIDGTVYDIEGGGGLNLILDAQKYSLEEQVVGIWTDGKPLYQRTWEFDTVLRVEANSWANSSILSADTHIDKIINANSIDQNGFNQKIGATTNGGAETYVRIFNYRSTIVIEIKSLTLLYTKTTDTAGSGGYQAYGFSPIIYSGVERQVGVWKDNKPLYQRTFEATSPSAIDTTTSVVTMPTGVEEVVGLTGFINQTGAVAQENVNFYIWFRKQQNDVACRVTNTNWRSMPLYITALYTKSTDTAGSGDYNTLAIPNVHYSTDEQVIGTWIDGSILYQKTWEFSSSVSLSANTWFTSSIPNTNMEKIINVEAMSETGTRWTVSGARDSGSYVNLICFRNNAITVKYVTLQYTKTTD